MSSANWKNKVILTFIFIFNVNFLHAQTETDTTHNKNKKVRNRREIDGKKHMYLCKYIFFFYQGNKFLFFII